MTNQEQDNELLAIQKIIEALTPLDIEARDRVVRYVFQRLNIASSPYSTSPPSPFAQPPASIAEPPTPPGRVNDIRTFKELKKPHSANEMTALVAYYLTELAPVEERKAEMSTAEIEKYFKQASFPLPAASRMALSNAKNAGYLDPGTERGMYKLNPVGHNLVAHNLPLAKSERKPPSSKKRAKKTTATKKKSSRR